MADRVRPGRLRDRGHEPRRGLRRRLLPQQQVGGVSVGPENNGALTIPANIVGNPAISIPIGTLDGLPVGMQVLGRHHEDALLLDLARVVERERPWPLVAPGAPI